MSDLNHAGNENLHLQTILIALYRHNSTLRQCGIHLNQAMVDFLQAISSELAVSACAFCTGKPAEGTITDLYQIGFPEGALIQFDSVPMPTGLFQYDHKDQYESFYKELVDRTGYSHHVWFVSKQHPDRNILIAHNEAIDSIEALPTEQITAFLEELVQLLVDLAADKNALKNLINCHSQQRFLDEQSLVGLIMIQHGRIRYANQYVCHASGYSLSEFQSWSPEEFLKLIHPDHRAFALEQLHKKMSGDPHAIPRYTSKIITKSGEEKWIELFSMVVDFEGHPADIITVIDIGVRMNALLSAEQYKFFIKNVDDMIYTQSLDGAITVLNETYSRITGYSTQELDKNPFLWREITQPDDLKIIEAFFAKYTNGVPSYEFEYRLKSKSGDWRWIQSHKVGTKDASGRIIGYHCIDRDITDRKRIEQRLGLLSQTVEQSAIGMAMTDLDGQLLYTNRTFTVMHGYSAEDIIGSNIYLFQNQNSQELLIQAMKQVKEKGSFSGELVHNKKDGQTFPAYLQNTLFRDKAGKPVGIIFQIQDITEKKVVEDALSESESRLRTIFDTEPECVLLLDQEGKIQEINTAGLKTLEIDNSSEIIGRSLQSFFSPKIKRQFKRLLNRVFEGKARDLECELIGQQGSLRWLDVRAVPLRTAKGIISFCLAVARDITMQKLALEALRVSEERYRSLVEQASDAIFILDHQAVIQDVNTVACTMLDYSRKELLEKPFADLIPHEELKLKPLIAQTLTTEETVIIERTLVHRDGHYISVEISAKGMQDGRFQGIARDISERKRQEEENHKREQRIKRQNESLLYLTRSGFLTTGDIPEVLSEITRTASEVNDVERVGIWVFTDNDQQIYAQDVYERGKEEHSSGQVLKVADFPEYFDALYKERAIVAHDVMNDPRTACMAKNYLEDLQVSSMLDAAIVLKGKVIGILCQEHTGLMRHWDTDEQQYSASLADLISLAFEAAERGKSEEALRESEERYALAALGANDGLWDWNLKTNVVYYSPRWKSMLGYEPDEITMFPDQWLDRVHPDDLPKLKTDIQVHLQGITPHFENEHRMQHKDKSYRWVLGRGMAVRDREGNATRIAGSNIDITDRKRAEEQLLHDAFHDVLTALPNRALFVDRLGHSIDLARRDPKFKFAVVMIDLDRFNMVNDSLGHFVGDKLLHVIAEKLHSFLRPGDTLARLGGDEFAILLEDVKHTNQVSRLIDRIQSAIAQPFRIEQHEVFTSGSIGITFSNVQYDRPELYLRDVDTAMYRAKAAGRGRAVIFDAQMHEKAQALLELETDLRRAIDRGEFLLYYQPIVNLEAGKLAGFESLVRWYHPKKGIVLPVEFINTAEDSGMILAIDRWVLNEACTQLQSWQSNGFKDKDISISVNLSGKQFNETSFLNFIESILQSSTLEPDNIRLEITESAIMENLEHATDILLKMKNLGFRLYIDDFGKGYSSLSYLHYFPLDALKIDRSFIKKMAENEDEIAIVHTIITLAHNLNMDVIAEGVETKQQLMLLRELNCDYAQGFYFSTPLTTQQAEDMMTQDVSWFDSDT